MDLRVTHYNSETHELEYKFTLSPKRTTGFDKLIQLVYIQLLKTPGRDIIEPEKGGGLYGLIGSNIDIENIKELYVDVSSRVKEVEQQMLDDQAGLDIPSEELLEKLILIDVKESGDQPVGIDAVVKIVNQTGKAAMARIPVTSLEGE